MTLRVRLCNTSGGCGTGDAGESVTTGPLGPGDSSDYTVTITPQIEGQRLLRFRLLLPDGYLDPTPNDTRREFLIEVLPSPG